MSDEEKKENTFTELGEREKQLRELHELAAKHNPKKPDPEIVARIQNAPEEKKQKGFERLMEFAARHDCAEPEELQRIQDLWGRWDDERDPHKKAVLQMELACCVALLLDHGEALDKIIDDANDALFEIDEPDVDHVLQCHAEDLPLYYRKAVEAGKKALEILQTRIREKVGG